MLEKMKEMIAEQLSCDADSITSETSFKEDLGADSRVVPCALRHRGSDRTGSVERALLEADATSATSVEFP